MTEHEIEAAEAEAGAVDEALEPADAVDDDAGPAGRPGPFADWRVWAGAGVVVALLLVWANHNLRRAAALNARKTPCPCGGAHAILEHPDEPGVTPYGPPDHPYAPTIEGGAARPGFVAPTAGSYPPAAHANGNGAGAPVEAAAAILEGGELPADDSEPIGPAVNP